MASAAAPKKCARFLPRAIRRVSTSLSHASWTSAVGWERVAGGFVRHLVGGQAAQFVVNPQAAVRRGLGVALLVGVRIA
jgi:hypothetical protein